MCTCVGADLVLFALPPPGEAVEAAVELDGEEAGWKPSKEPSWLGPKESAVRLHRQEMKAKMKTNKVEEARPARPKQVSILY